MVRPWFLLFESLRFAHGLREKTSAYSPNGGDLTVMNPKRRNRKNHFKQTQDPLDCSIYLQLVDFCEIDVGI